MTQTKADKLAGTKISRRAHTWCTKEQADFIAAKLSSLALIEAELASAKRAFKDEHALLTIVEAQLADEKLHVKQLERGIDKLLAVNKVLVDALTYMVHIFKGTDAHYSPAIKAVSDANKALKLAGEIK
jgi:hypothetical protein